ncbi:hypothetical protein GOP47_0002157 [Adiantum capillus-veneris]|uniref:Uncharacterized protein n=1 Tax=Adiantum capillus-veneris TaxID=13818 RepID=A0A9D4VAC8_ADICA|nr:hypothetical protein GOP47_0002157 [Adiantum capillus-veneris]
MRIRERACHAVSISFGSASSLRDGFLRSSHFRLLCVTGLNRWVLMKLGPSGVFEGCVSDKANKRAEIWPIVVVVYKAWRLTPRKNASLARTVRSKSGVSKRECVRIDVSHLQALRQLRVSVVCTVNRISLSNHLFQKAKGKLAVHKLDARKRKKQRWLLLRSRGMML